MLLPCPPPRAAPARRAELAGVWVPVRNALGISHALLRRVILMRAPIATLDPCFLLDIGSLLV